jgi:hypothetical protein
MEILCPNCQRKLTIQEQYAGQQMKCPLCAGMFTAPALPATPGIPPAPSAAPVTPPAPSPTAGAPAPVSAPGPAAFEPAAPPPPSEPVPTEHTGRISIWISPRYTQFVPVVLLFFVFVLTFFTWVAFAPGNVTIDSQNAWQATFGSWSTDPDLKSWSAFSTKFKAAEPGFGVVMLFWFLVYFLTFLLAIAAVALSFTHRFLPPKVQPFLRWRWALVALVGLLGFFFLLLQDAIGFNLEQSVHSAIRKEFDKRDEARNSEDFKKLPAEQQATQIKENNIERGISEQAVVQRSAYRSVWWLYFWSVAFLFITMLADLRSPRPSPRIDLLI